MNVDWNSRHPFHASLIESSELTLPCARAVSCCHSSVGNGRAKDGDACAKVNLIYHRISLTLINVFRFIRFLFVPVLAESANRLRVIHLQCHGADDDSGSPQEFCV
jgi:hypothetical protein